MIPALQRATTRLHQMRADIASWVEICRSELEDIDSFKVRSDSALMRKFMQMFFVFANPP